MEKEIYVNTQILNKDTKKHIAKDELQVGQEVFAPHFVGFSIVRVVEINGDEATSESDDSVWFLKYEEKYGRWLNSMGINKKALKELKNWDKSIEKPRPNEQADSRTGESSIARIALTSDPGKSYYSEDI
jgi:hypothetical protein